MKSALLQAALDEERQLLARLDAVRAVIRAYEGPEQGVAAETPKVPVTRSPSDMTKKIKGLLLDLLRGETNPTPTRELVTFLDGEGIKVGGKNPVATLSALLSHAEEFVPVGRSGWILKSRTPDAGTSGAASTGGATTPPIESQKEVNPTD